MLKGIFKNEQGGALMLVVMASFIVLAFTMITIMLSRSSVKQASGEQYKTQAYYVAKTGAESLVKYLQDEVGSGPTGGAAAIRTELNALIKEGEGTGTYDNGEFTIKITKDDVEPDKYELKSTGKVNNVEDWIIADLNIGKIPGTGYNIGNGQIFSNSSIQIDIESVPQLVGKGLSIYALDEKYDSKVPIHMNEPGNINELFRSISGRATSKKVKDLNAQESDKKYRLEITQPEDKESQINKDNPIKVENLVRYKGKDKDPDFEKLEFIYGTNKKDLLHYFSKQILSKDSITKLEIEKGLKNTFLLPIRSVKDYEDYIASSKVYPDSPTYVIPSGAINKGNITVDGKKETELDLTGHKNIQLGKIYVANSGILNIKVSDGASIYVDGGIDTNDSTPKNKINIEVEGKVDFYIKGSITFDGDIIAKGSNAEVNFYMYEGVAVFNNNTVVENINLYAPKTKVTLNKVIYKGIIVGGQVDFKNDDSTFLAPSSGPASTGISESEGLKVEWRR